MTTNRLVRQPQWSAWLAGAACVVAMLGSPASAGAAPAEVDISDGFLSDELPLGKPFVLSMKVTTETVAVYGMAVQYAFGAWGTKAGSEVKSCSELQRYLPTDPATTAFEGKSGELELRQVLTPKAPEADRTATPPAAKAEETTATGPEQTATALGKRPVLMLLPWHRDPKAATTETHAKLRFPDTSFFKRGAHYCLITVKVTARETTDTDVSKWVDEISKVFADCTATDQCAAEVREKLPKGALEGEKGKLFDAHIGKAINVRSRAKSAKVVFLEAEELFKADTKVTPRVMRVRRKTDLETEPLGEMIALTLARAGFLTEVVGNDSRVFLSKDGDWELQTIQFDEELRVTGDFKRKNGKGTLQQSTFDIDTKTLMLPGNTGLTLRQLLLFARGQIEIGADTFTFKQLESKISDLQPLKVTAADKAFWTSVNTLFRSVEQFARAAGRAVPPKAPAAGPDLRRGFLSDPILERAGKWMEDMKLDLAKQDENDEASDAGLATRLSAKSGDIVAALNQWDPSRTVIKRVVEEIEPPAVLSVRFGLSPNTWFLTYVTPMFGYAATYDSIDTYALTLQIYLFPNSSDEPMWTNGGLDVRRMVSLELGVAPKAGDFGPDDRFSGPGDLPPLMVGIGHQIIPYTVISGGLMIVDAKDSTLKQESPHVTVSPYVGFAVNINVPDIVKSSFEGKSTPGE
jgi:hypothetical protein